MIIIIIIIIMGALPPLEVLDLLIDQREDLRPRQLCREGKDDGASSLRASRIHPRSRVLLCLRALIADDSSSAPRSSLQTRGHVSAGDILGRPCALAACRLPRRAPQQAAATCPGPSNLLRSRHFPRKYSEITVLNKRALENYTYALFIE